MSLAAAAAVGFIPVRVERQIGKIFKRPVTSAADAGSGALSTSRETSGRRPDRQRPRAAGARPQSGPQWPRAANFYLRDVRNNFDGSIQSVNFL